MQILSQAPCSQTSSACSWDEVSHPHKNSDKIKVLYVLIVMFFYMAGGETKDYELNGSKNSLNFITLNFFVNAISTC
jgi:hypothetical protein